MCRYLAELVMLTVLKVTPMLGIPLLTLLTLFSYLPSVHSDLRPYGAEIGHLTTPFLDSGSSPALNISPPFGFYGSQYSTVYVNNDGSVSFAAAADYQDTTVVTGNKAAVCGFCSDIDVTKSGTVWYGISMSLDERQIIADDVRAYNDFPPDYLPLWVMVVTWDGVASFIQTDGQVNTFQVVMATDGTRSVVQLIYDVISWVEDTVDYSEYYDDVEPPGIRAQCGFLAGDGNTSYLLPESRSEDLLNISLISNVGIPGRFVFRVDQDVVQLSVKSQTNLTGSTVLVSTPSIHSSTTYLLFPSTSLVPESSISFSTTSLIQSPSVSSFFPSSTSSINAQSSSSMSTSSIPVPSTSRIISSSSISVTSSLMSTSSILSPSTTPIPSPSTLLISSPSTSPSISPSTSSVTSLSTSSIPSPSTSSIISPSTLVSLFPSTYSIFSPTTFNFLSQFTSFISSPSASSILSSSTSSFLSQSTSSLSSPSTSSILSPSTSSSLSPFTSFFLCQSTSSLSSPSTSSILSSSTSSFLSKSTSSLSSPSTSFIFSSSTSSFLSQSTSSLSSPSTSSILSSTTSSFLSQSTSSLSYPSTISILSSSTYFILSSSTSSILSLSTSSILSSSISSFLSQCTSSLSSPSTSSFLSSSTSYSLSPSTSSFISLSTSSITSPFTSSTLLLSTSSIISQSTYFIISPLTFSIVSPSTSRVLSPSSSILSSSTSSLHYPSVFSTSSPSTKSTSRLSYVMSVSTAEIGIITLDNDSSDFVLSESSQGFPSTEPSLHSGSSVDITLSILHSTMHHLLPSDMESSATVVYTDITVSPLASSMSSSGSLFSLSSSVSVLSTISTTPLSPTSSPSGETAISSLPYSLDFQSDVDMADIPISDDVSKSIFQITSSVMPSLHVSSLLKSPSSSLASLPPSFSVTPGASDSHQDSLKAITTESSATHDMTSLTSIDRTSSKGNTIQATNTGSLSISNVEPMLSTGGGDFPTISRIEDTSDKDLTIAESDTITTSGQVSARPVILGTRSSTQTPLFLGMFAAALILVTIGTLQAALWWQRIRELKLKKRRQSDRQHLPLRVITSGQSRYQDNHLSLKANNSGLAQYQASHPLSSWRNW